MIAQTTSRDGTVRAVSRGIMPKRFEVKLPDGVPWDLIKTNIEQAEALDRYQTAQITIPYLRFPWYYGYTDPGGGAETYTVICSSFPEWTIMARNQVSWSGAFVFVEVLS